jgi:hypothetical protein
VRGFGDAVFLEGTVDCVAGEEGLGTQRLVGLLAEVAGEAGSVEPFDTGVVTDFDVVDKLANSDDDTCAFVASNEGELGGLEALLVPSLLSKPYKKQYKLLIGA